MMKAYGLLNFMPLYFDFHHNMLIAHMNEEKLIVLKP